MRHNAHAVWIPTRRRAGIFAPPGWSASSCDVMAYGHGADGVQALGITLKEDET